MGKIDREPFMSIEFLDWRSVRMPLLPPLLTYPPPPFVHTRCRPARALTVRPGAPPPFTVWRGFSSAFSFPLPPVTNSLLLRSSAGRSSSGTSVPSYLYHFLGVRCLRRSAFGGGTFHVALVGGLSEASPSPLNERFVALLRTLPWGRVPLEGPATLVPQALVIPPIFHYRLFSHWHRGAPAGGGVAPALPPLNIVGTSPLLCPYTSRTQRLSFISRGFTIAPAFGRGALVESLQTI